jgi:hypothetical protein
MQRRLYPDVPAMDYVTILNDAQISKPSRQIRWVPLAQRFGLSRLVFSITGGGSVSRWGKSGLMLAAASLRHVAGTNWGTRR